MAGEEEESAVPVFFKRQGRLREDTNTHVEWWFNVVSRYSCLSAGVSPPFLPHVEYRPYKVN